MVRRLAAVFGGAIVWLLVGAPTTKMVAGAVIGGRASGATGFVSPHRPSFMAVSSKGVLYVLDQGRHQVLRYDGGGGVPSNCR
jgi:hypothetical protein